METDNAALLAAAAAGDSLAWNALVDRYHRLVWSVVRSLRVRDADAGDVVQTTWLKLVENLSRIGNPDALGSWLATTARRECLRILYRSTAARAVPTPAEQLDRVDAAPAVDAAVLADERNRVVWAAVGELGERCRQLLRLLMAADRPVYAEVAAAMNMPVGSIGPTRQRCLDRLRSRIAGLDELVRD